MVILAYGFILAILYQNCEMVTAGESLALDLATIVDIKYDK